MSPFPSALALYYIGTLIALGILVGNVPLVATIGGTLLVLGAAGERRKEIERAEKAQQAIIEAVKGASGSGGVPRIDLTTDEE